MVGAPNLPSSRGMARPSLLWYAVWLLTFGTCVSSVTNLVESGAEAVEREATSGPNSADPNLAGSVAVVFVTGRDAETLSPCRKGLLNALFESTKHLPNHDVFVLHGGEASGLVTMDNEINGESLEVNLLSQSKLKPHLPKRLECDCSSGNGGTPFLFATWLGHLNGGKYDFAWYVEEDVVFTGRWGDLFSLRVEETQGTRIRAASVFGIDAANDAPIDSSRALSSDAHSKNPVDLVAHVTRVESTWKKRCRMPTSDSQKFPNGTGCVGYDGFMHKTWWPVLGMSANFANSLIDSIDDQRGANGHQEPITMSFCRRVEREKQVLYDSKDSNSLPTKDSNAHSVGCRSRLIPDEMIGEYQLGHWGRFIGRPKSHATFTSAGLTFGHNLESNKLYHPLKCEADAGIGKLAVAVAKGGVERSDDSDPSGDDAIHGEILDTADGVESKKLTQSPRHALADKLGEGGSGGGGGALELGAMLSWEVFQEVYFTPKPWALTFEDDKSRAEIESARDEPFEVKLKSALERYAAKSEKAKVAARPYLRPVRGPKKNTGSSTKPPPRSAV